MACTSTYLNFARNTEEAFKFYKSVFGGKFRRNGIAPMELQDMFRGAYIGSSIDKYGVQWMFNFGDK